MITVGPTRVSVALCVPPFKAAVIVADSSFCTAATAAENCAPVWPASTVTEPGTVTLELLSLRVTTVVEPAAETRVTEQVAVPAVGKEEGEQLRPLRPDGATRPTWVDRVVPFSVAEMLAVWLVPIVPAVTVNVPVVAPLAMVTVGGTESTSLSSDKVSVVPPAEGLSKLTVQVAL